MIAPYTIRNIKLTGSNLILSPHGHIMLIYKNNQLYQTRSIVLNTVQNKSDTQKKLRLLDSSDLKYIYVSLRLRVQNAVSPQPCVGKFRISLVLLNFLHCNFRLWFETP